VAAGIEEIQVEREFRRMVVTERLRERIVSQPCKIGKLILILEETYLTNSEASTDQIVSLTEGMVSHSQRIGQMKKCGIEIVRNVRGGIHYYQLRRNVAQIDWENYRLRMAETPIEPRELHTKHNPKPPVMIQEKLL